MAFFLYPYALISNYLLLDLVTARAMRPAVYYGRWQNSQPIRDLSIREMASVEGGFPNGG